MSDKPFDYGWRPNICHWEHPGPEYLYFRITKSLGIVFTLFDLLSQTHTTRDSPSWVDPSQEINIQILVDISVRVESFLSGGK